MEMDKWFTRKYGFNYENNIKRYYNKYSKLLKFDYERHMADDSLEIGFKYRVKRKIKSLLRI